VPEPVLLDTGCIVALLDRSETHHEQCVQVLSDLDSPLVTCEAVIAESCHLLRKLRGAPASVLKNVERGVFQIPFSLSGSASRVKSFMARFSSVPMDLADACLVAMAEDLGTGRILTLDSGFHIFRWRRNRPFKLLIEL
jgi:predicted nucleic acid-binding protein